MKGGGVENTIIKKTKYQEAYRCENGHVTSMDSIAFHGCCPKCGSKNILIVTEFLGKRICND